MRQQIAMFTIVLTGFGPVFAVGDSKEEAVIKELAALKGTWVVVSAERDGIKLSNEQIEGVRFTIEETGKAFVKKGEQIIFEGIIHIDPRKNPKTEDATQTSEGENKGKTVLSTITLADADGGTYLLAVHDGLPRGVSLADNETGWRMVLEKLATLVEGGHNPP